MKCPKCESEMTGWYLVASFKPHNAEVGKFVCECGYEEAIEVEHIYGAGNIIRGYRIKPVKEGKA